MAVALGGAAGSLDPGAGVFCPVGGVAGVPFPVCGALGPLGLFCAAGFPVDDGCSPAEEAGGDPGAAGTVDPGAEVGGGATALTAPPPPFDRATPIAPASVSIVGSVAVTVFPGRLPATPPISEASVLSVCGSVTVGLFAAVMPFPVAAARAPVRLASARRALINC